MALRTIITVIVVVVTLLLLQMVLAEPFFAVTEGLNASLDASIPGYDANEQMSTNQRAWVNMGWIAIFGVMTWGLWRVLRRELTRGRRR